MAGVKGRSGGPRANSGGSRANSGGARPGAGRKPLPRPEPATPAPARAGFYDTAELYLEAIVQGREPPDQLRIAAAKTLIAYQQARRRAPVATAPPREMARLGQMADDTAVVQDFEQRAAEIRARYGRR